MPRYFFVLPDVTKPVGGVNVALRFVDTLCEAGYEAAALYSQPGFRYHFFDTSCQAYFYPPLAEVPRQFMGRKKRILESLARLTRPRKGSANHLLNLRPDDVFVIPEFLYPEYSAIFPNNPRILLAQDVFGFCRAYKRDLGNAEPCIDKFEIIITTSEASRAAVEQFSNSDSYVVPQAVSRPSLAYTSQKKLQIAYMPRKRADEVSIVVDCLKKSPALNSWNFVKIDGASPEKLDSILRESLIFLSFSYREGFGLPPAEAMASGCIVVGYSGVGGEEFFQPEFGLPIPDSDVVRFVATVEAAADEYSQNPTRLDYMRKSASQYIHAQYSLDSMREKLLTLWKDIDEKILLG
ncbi:glycosyltransferase [Paracoccus sp. WLY502]|uniref:glycosyltransferase n=1 Tax=Paracoccus yibinensis TaxID=3068891 RepID=UPI0027969029|nr:glycosyltransferase [Paracoccus sp. WLY502]MDQ1902849.1 glycosyltransferase [Paracoccus sp. WLY502]